MLHHRGPTTVENRTVLVVSQQVPEYEAWIRACYPELLSPTFSEATVKHGVELHIPTQGRTVFAQARRLPTGKPAVAKEAFNKMEDSGIVRRSESAWSSLLHLVPKDDGSWRPCGDFRRLNNITEADKYPVPQIQDFSAQLAGRRIFSKIDLIRSYHQIPVAKQDVHKMVVITPFGLYEFLRIPFGLKNAAQAFQRLMDSICQGLEFVFVYLDDTLIASRDRDEHQAHLAKFFNRLRDQGLVLNLAKCQWGQTSLRFLGHHVSAEGIAPAADKVKAVMEFPLPKMVRQLLEFSGMVNLYHRFLPRAAQLMSPLYDATAGVGTSKASMARTVEWTPDRVKAFQATKVALAAAACLVHFTAGSPLALTTDASDFAVGAVLEQQVHGVWVPLGFYISRFKPTKVESHRPMTLQDFHRSAVERELLVAYRAVQHFWYILEGRKFTLFKPLVTMMSKAADSRCPMQA